ncbi:MAG: hypothetical protein OFPII_22420 [Osedax symbiont Rs1]|nr:MAG: hypothetical protein OFPII_22420 [Osedax symbiont Rs1]
MPSSASCNKNLNVVAHLIEQLQQASTDQARKTLISSIEVSLVDVELYHHFGAASYGRNLVFSNADFEVILMCWQSNQHSTAHDHNGSLCVMKCLAGELEEQRYIKTATQTPALLAAEKKRLVAGATSSITDLEGLHSIRNSSQRTACSLHFYFPAIHSTNVYCLKDGSQKSVTSVFTSEYGKLIG